MVFFHRHTQLTTQQGKLEERPLFGNDDYNTLKNTGTLGEGFLLGARF